VDGKIDGFLWIFPSTNPLNIAITIPRVNIQDVEKAFLVLPGMMFYKWWGGNPHPSELKLGGNSLQRSFHR